LSPPRGKIVTAVSAVAEPRVAAHQLA